MGQGGGVSPHHALALHLGVSVRPLAPSVRLRIVRIPIRASFRSQTSLVSDDTPAKHAHSSVRIAAGHGLVYQPLGGPHDIGTLGASGQASLKRWIIDGVKSRLAPSPEIAGSSHEQVRIGWSTLLQAAFPRTLASYQDSTRTPVDYHSLGASTNSLNRFKAMGRYFH